jgi:CRISPR-associated helicase Cas3
MDLKATEYQKLVQEKVKDGESILLVAPTGLGKTFAATGDLSGRFCKTVYAVPLRALGNDIKRSVSEWNAAEGTKINPAIHHGGIQESTLFSEDFIVTTYDQVVCGVPGLPLSLPLKSGHAVAGALLMSRLIFDEAHLAWGISKEALTILLAITKFRSNFGLQTILMTATLPDAVSKHLADELKMERILIGKGGEIEDDEGLLRRDENRQVKAELLELKRKGDEKKLDLSPSDKLLVEGNGKRIYFANTVERLQKTYDRLIQKGIDQERILVLHNRMPHVWRTNVETQVKEHFSKDSKEGDWILLTNQVSEAGLDISAPLVISDPAPVDTLVQRAGRCARWFRESITEGRFIVLKVPGLSESNPSDEAKEYAAPYHKQMPFVVSALKSFPTNKILSWEIERQWVNEAWGGGEQKALDAVKESLNKTTFALNLFDRAAQENKPGEIANIFREILSVEVAVEKGHEVRIDDLADRDLQQLVDEGKFPDSSSISLGKAYGLFNKAEGRAGIIRYDKEENQFLVRKVDNVQLGDVLILPSSLAYLHKKKGLCFVSDKQEETQDEDTILSSEWSFPKRNKGAFSPGLQKRQSLWEHTRNVMDGTFKKFIESESPYRQTLLKVLRKLENIEDENKLNQLADLVANLAKVAAGFHDLGKAGASWQKKVREIDPTCLPGLVGRSLSAGKKRIGVPHTPPGYVATVSTCRLLIGVSNEAPHPLDTLIRAIALATCRHHSSLFNPARVENYKFDPHPETEGFVRDVLAYVGASPELVACAKQIIVLAKTRPSLDEVPLMLPNEDLFSIYSLVGRAILMADREDAGGVIKEHV